MIIRTYMHNDKEYKYIDNYTEKDFSKLKDDDYFRIDYNKQIIDYLDEKKIENIEDTALEDKFFTKEYLNKYLYNSAELDLVEGILTSLVDWIKQIDRKDQKNYYRKQKNFIINRDNLIKECKKINTTNQEREALKIIASIEYKPYEIFTNYEDVLRNKKKELDRVLQYELNVKSSRAKKIIRILDFI